MKTYRIALIALLSVIFCGIVSVKAAPEATEDYRAQLAEENADTQQPLQESVLDFLELWNSTQDGKIEVVYPDRSYIIRTETPEEGYYLATKVFNDRGFSGLKENNPREFRIVPFQSPEAQTGMMEGVKTETGWDWIGLSFFPYSVLSLSDVLDRADESGLREKVTEVNMYYDKLYAAYYAIIRAGEKEYLMPCDETWSEAGILRGELYDWEEFVIRMDSFYDEKADQEMRKEGAATGAVYGSEGIMKRTGTQPMMAYGIIGEQLKKAAETILYSMRTFLAALYD